MRFLSCSLFFVNSMKPPARVCNFRDTDLCHGILERGSNSVTNGSGSERIIAQKYEIVIYDLKIAIATYVIRNTRIQS